MPLGESRQTVPPIPIDLGCPADDGHNPLRCIAILGLTTDLPRSAFSTHNSKIIAVEKVYCPTDCFRLQFLAPKLAPDGEGQGGI